MRIIRESMGMEIGTLLLCSEREREREKRERERFTAYKYFV